MTQTAIIKQSELGTNCWLPARFIKGLKCPAVSSCKYPERATCKAAEWEDWLVMQKLGRMIVNDTETD